jgi:hypothetical protein
LPSLSSPSSHPRELANSHVAATVETSAAGDAIPENCEIIEVRVADLRQLFNSIDPAPFRERDLDPNVEEFIVDWAREVPSSKPLALLVRLDRPAGTADEAEVVRDAIHQFFAHRAASTRGRLRQLFRVGRISLVIGLAVLTMSIGVAQFIARRTSQAGLGQVLHESLLIGGWVAMWRPLEVFLYDWWPILAEARLYDRLAAMPVRISYATNTAPPT